MNDRRKTKQQLIAELAELRQQLARPQAADGANQHSDAQRDWQRTFDAVPDLVAILDMNHRIVRVNRAMAQRVGRTCAECVGRSCYELIHGTDHPPGFCPHLLTLADGLGHAAEAHEDHLGGDFLVTTTPLLDERGAAVGSVHVARDITQRKKDEESLRRERRTLERMWRASDRERQLIAYDIHDGIAQQLAGAKMQFEVFMHLQQRDPDEAGRALAAGLEGLRGSLEEVRRLISGLRPPILDERGVVAAIEHLINDARNHPDFALTFDCDIGCGRLDPLLENALFRIVQEAITNARRYSKSSRVFVELTQEGNQFVLTIQDWGKGFSLNQVGDGCYGLEGIRERARLLGGRATIDSAPDQGTRIRVELPVQPGETDA